MLTTHHYRVSGEVDLVTAPDLHADLDALAANAHIGMIVLDCGGLTFIDSAGFVVLLAVQRRLESDGRELCLEHVAPWLRRVLDATGLTGVLRVHD